MAVRRKIQKREALLGFEALSIEGGLLSPDWLSRVARLDAGLQSEVDYRIPKGLNLRDEIGRYWRIAQAHWNEFTSGRANNSDTRLLAERFVVALLKDCFGFATLSPVGVIVHDERSYPIGFAGLGGRVPVVIASAASGLDTLTSSFGDGSRRRSAFGLAQEFINAVDDVVWGLASDGVHLRVLRDNTSLTRPAWIEADLARIFTEERYADFAALWLLVHETRFGRPDGPITECALETWRSYGLKEGTRAREHLRRGVEEALVVLGQGFLTHSENLAMRSSLQDGSLTTREYFNQLLRLVYRLIFLLTVEERGLLHHEGADEKAKTLYTEGYSLRRLRDCAVKRGAHDRYSDLWEATKIVFRGLAGGEPRLGLPALAGLFAASQCSALDAAKLENRSLLLAVFRLSWLRDDSGLSRVNWRDMGPEELGSVYESLLELVPQITNDGRQFTFATGGATKGNTRKTTGSYYTPDSLVQVLLDNALEPVITDTIAKNPRNTVDALLKLSIVDPACGSGHFLLAAARRLAAHVARQQANGTPSASEYRHALRQVVGRCIYGVDLNSMAVELCKVSLWMEAVEPGLPLTFLDSHIRHGNALLGTTPELMSKGIPDTAWDPIEGDDKKIATALKKRNKISAEGQRSFDTLWSPTVEGEAKMLASAVAELEATSDGDPAALAQKESKWDAILDSPEYKHQKFVADAWCAAFVWPKEPGTLAEVAPTNDLWRQIRDRVGQPHATTVKTVQEIAEEYSFLHWRLAFPHVFERGGFDVVLGNPPWDKIQPEEIKFFAHVRPDIASAASAKIRKALIADLSAEDPPVHRQWIAYKRKIDGMCHFLRSSGVVKFTGEGNLNSYRIFAEINAGLISPIGRTGIVAQTGLATDESGKEFFDYLLSSGRLAQFLDFENRESFFPDVDSRMRFCLVTITGERTHVSGQSAEFGWLLHSLEDLKVPGRLVKLNATDVRLFNPTSRTSPVFPSARDLDIARRIYQAGEHIMLDESRRFADVDFLGELFNMTRDSKYFMKEQSPNSLPLYEAKFIHQYDHHFAAASDDDVIEIADVAKADAFFCTRPISFVDERLVRERSSRRGIGQNWLCGFRDIASATNERTCIFAILPFSAVGNSINLVLGLSAKEAMLLVANANSFVFDYSARQKISGTHVNIWIFKQLPAIPLRRFMESSAWTGGKTVMSWLLPRILELTFTAWDLESFARDAGYDGPPFRWDPARRFLLRCEVDAAFFRLYGLSREDAAYVMDTFPIVRKNDEKVHGEYRTKRVILEVYDAMTEAEKTGKPYQTRLDPAPADPRVAHAPRFVEVPMPDAMPNLEASEDLARFVWAALHVGGGTVARSDLARACSLRGQPEVLTKIAPAQMKSSSRDWARKAGDRAVKPSGAVIGMLRQLEQRNGVRFTVDAAGRSMVGTADATPAAEALDAWFLFEAALVLKVLSNLSPAQIQQVDEALSGDDRALLRSG